MYSREEIKSKSKLVTDIVNLVLSSKEMSVDKIYLIGSYASGRANEYSDIDFLVIVKGGKRQYTYPTWADMMEIRKKIDNIRIHCIYAVSLEAQQSMYKRDPIKYAYREIL